jgi:hypothetical protein
VGRQGKVLQKAEEQHKGEGLLEEEEQRQHLFNKHY